MRDTRWRGVATIGSVLLGTLHATGLQAQTETRLTPPQEGVWYQLVPFSGFGFPSIPAHQLMQGWSHACAQAKLFARGYISGFPLAMHVGYSDQGLAGSPWERCRCDLEWATYVDPSGCACQAQATMTCRTRGVYLQLDDPSYSSGMAIGSCSGDPTWVVTNQSASHSGSVDSADLACEAAMDQADTQCAQVAQSGDPGSDVSGCCQYEIQYVNYSSSSATWTCNVRAALNAPDPPCPDGQIECGEGEAGGESGGSSSSGGGDPDAFSIGPGGGCDRWQCHASGYDCDGEIFCASGYIEALGHCLDVCQD